MSPKRLLDGEMKSLSGNSMNTLNEDTGHVSLQAWEYAGCQFHAPVVIEYPYT
jgi:hypothetical protein